MQQDPGLNSRRTGRVAGTALMAAALLIIFAMAHHPTGYGGGGGGGGGMTLGGFVHGTMLILLATMLWVLIVYSLRQDKGAASVAAIAAYAISFVGNMLAAIINGFIAPAVIGKVEEAARQDAGIVLWASNQALATLGLYAASVAFLIWALQLLRREGLDHRIIGALGILAALGPATALFSGAIELNVRGALIAYATHSLWTGLLGVQMFRGRC